MGIPSQRLREKPLQVDKDTLACFINEFGDLDGEVFISQESLAHYCTRIINSHVVGCTKVQPANWYQADISHVIVHPDFRRNNLGRSLLDEACERARFSECRVVQTTVARDNVRSEHLFRSLGFNPTTSFLGLSGRTLFLWSKVL